MKIVNSPFLKSMLMMMKPTWSLEQAYAYHQQLVAEENHLPLTRNLINRDREGAEERLMTDYFNDHCRVRPDATGRMSLNVIMKFTVAICQLAYGTTPDAFDEYLQMRKPTLEDVENMYNKHLTAHGFSGMLGSIDCARKDVKRAFGVLQGRWGIIQQPSRSYYGNTLRRVMYSCIILHNLILKDQKMAVFD
nr:nucleotide-binding, alpha-beta plait [Tanacetum cinerariifolium]